MVAIAVLATVAAFIVIELLIRRGHGKLSQDLTAPSRRIADHFLIPRGYFLSRGHSWIELTPSGDARIGIDDFVQKLVGPVDSIESAPRFSSIKRGDPLFTLHQEQRSLAIPSPLTGRITEVNPILTDDPAALNTDPYRSGWGVVLEPENLGEELPLLNIAEAAGAWLKGELGRFRNFIKESVNQADTSASLEGATLLDGGMPVSGVLKTTDDLTWRAFEREFLSDRAPTV